MRHTRSEVIQRTIREFELLDDLVAGLANQDWERLLPRPETKDPWTVKDALAHITHWKADVARSVRKQPRPIEERGLNINDGNRLSSTYVGEIVPLRRSWLGTGRFRRTYW
jgi:hypothetical protein